MLELEVVGQNYFSQELGKGTRFFGVFVSTNLPVAGDENSCRQLKHRDYLAGVCRS